MPMRQPSGDDSKYGCRASACCKFGLPFLPLGASQVALVVMNLPASARDIRDAGSSYPPSLSPLVLIGLWIFKNDTESSRYFLQNHMSTWICA